MGNYYSPIVFEGGIPRGCLSPCADMVLRGLFECYDDEENGLAWFYSSEGRADVFAAGRAELKSALAASAAAGFAGPAEEKIAELVARGPTEAGPSPDGDLYEEEGGEMGWESIVGNALLGEGAPPFLAVTKCSTSDKMEPGAWAGTAILITPSGCWSKSTDEVLEELKRAAGLGAP